MIELKQVTKEYGRAAVLKNITLTLEESGIYCLLSYVFWQLASPWRTPSSTW